MDFLVGDERTRSEFILSVSASTAREFLSGKLVPVFSREDAVRKPFSEGTSTSVEKLVLRLSVGSPA